MKYILIIFLIIIFIIISFIIINKNIHSKNIIENYCKIPDTNPQYTINDKRVLLDYPPQSNINTSSCDKYWKDWPLESNNTLVENNPIVIKSDQLELPKEKQFANNTYLKGLINYKELAKYVSDKIPEDILKISNELLIDPITYKEFKYKYELEYSYIELNKKTYINRWQKYNPSVKTYFNYDEIKSPIENINILNKKFNDKCYIEQKNIIKKRDIILFGLIEFEIFKYKILKINYINRDIKRPVYIIEIALFREEELYFNTFSYIGFIKDNIPIISNVEYIGRNSTDNILLAEFHNPKELKQNIINKNFDNSVIIEKDPDAIVKLTKDYQEAYKLKNQYACFNINYDPKRKEQYILPYYSREQCESSVDFYGRPKNIGIYDTPCKTNEECPFYKSNKNYNNDHGKCMKNGYCELPLNMTRIGYKYYSNNDKPLCYNCDNFEFDFTGNLDTCCTDQFDTKKYPYLQTPDYAFNDDLLDRKNYFRGKFCKLDINKPYDKLDCTKYVTA